MEPCPPALRAKARAIVFIVGTGALCLGVGLLLGVAAALVTFGALLVACASYDGVLDRQGY